MTYHDPEVTYQGGYIKLFRSFKDWEWYTDSKTVHLFIHILLHANWKQKPWKGIEVKRGQFITSYDSLSFYTGMTKQEVRTRLKRLEKTGEINTQTNKRFTLITVCKYEIYQRIDDDDNTPPNTPTTHDQHTANTQITPTEESNKEKKERNLLAKNLEDRNSKYPRPILKVGEYTYYDNDGLRKLYKLNEFRVDIEEAFEKLHKAWREVTFNDLDHFNKWFLKQCRNKPYISGRKPKLAL